MKLFFGLNEEGSEFANYAKMLQVAVYTAQKFTSLEPHVLYDGAENWLTEWLKRKNVRVINCRSFLYPQLEQIAVRKNDRNYLGIGAGAFLRTEIPRLSIELGITDKFVLYTDLDVMFLGEVVDSLSQMSPKYFAVAPESFVTDYKHINTGVMLMNLGNLRRQDEKFRAFMLANIEMLTANFWDQTAYKSFYKRRFYGYKWNVLPNEFNWKPYWGANLQAKIIHFHGPKPTQRELLSEPSETAEHLKPLLRFVTADYQNYSEKWQEFYAQATT